MASAPCCPRSCHLLEAVKMLKPLHGGLPSTTFTLIAGHSFAGADFDVRRFGAKKPALCIQAAMPNASSCSTFPSIVNPSCTAALANAPA